jgi:hypothetical protein
VEGDKDRLQRGISLLSPLPDQVIDCHGSPKTTRSSGRFAYPAWSVGEWAVLRACERLVYQTDSGMCHFSAAWPALCSKTSSSPRRQRPRGQSGSRWGSRCQVVFKRGSCLSTLGTWVAWQSCASANQSNLPIWWRGPERVALLGSLGRRGPNTSCMLLVEGCYHRIHLSHYRYHAALHTEADCEILPSVLFRCSVVNTACSMRAACRTLRAGDKEQALGASDWAKTWNAVARGDFHVSATGTVSERHTDRDR